MAPAIILDRDRAFAAAAGLAARGIVLRPDDRENSGVHIILRRAAGYEGGADPRRDGVAKGY